MQATLTESSSADAWDGVGHGGAGGKNSEGSEDTVEGEGTFIILAAMIVSCVYTDIK